ncbi:MAG: hypothetical protein AAFS07_02375 [Pseudomonadota bacterium]
MYHPHHPETLRADGERLQRYTAIERARLDALESENIRALVTRRTGAGPARSARYAQIERGHEA